MSVTDTPLLPSVSLTDETPLSQTSVYIYIIISMVAAIIIGNIIVCTIIIIIIMVKRRKRNFSLEATSLEGLSYYQTISHHSYIAGRLVDSVL